jgi:hypothetical protein
MKLTSKQQKDLETIIYFIPKCKNNPSITEEDIKMFFEYSDKGLHKELVDTYERLYLYPDKAILELMKTWQLNTVPKYSINRTVNIVSESGISLEEFNKHRGFKLLCEGKKWRGIHIHEMWEEGILEGSTPYFTILGGYDKTIKRKWWQFWKPKQWLEHEPMPRSVVDFIKKDIFKGQDADTIEKCYQSIIN